MTEQVEQGLQSSNDNEEKDNSPSEYGTIIFTDPLGEKHELAILGYHVISSDEGYLLIIGSDATHEYISSDQFSIIKFKNDEISSIETEEEYKVAYDIFQEELSRQVIN